MSRDGTPIGTVAECWRYVVKSMQGECTDDLVLGTDGIEGDRSWGLLDAATDHLLSAKRYPVLLTAGATPDGIDLPDGTHVDFDDATADAVLSAWLGREVRLRRPSPGAQPSYEMTFDPPHDDAELFEIPVPPGSFVDLAPVHLVSAATLSGASGARPDLQWDVRRFRPNLMVHSDGSAWEENAWAGRHLAVGPEVVLAVSGPTVRCAMPLRAQPAHDGRPALDRQADVFRAITELNAEVPNHLGAYASVRTPGRVSVGDEVVLLPPVAEV